MSLFLGTRINSLFVLLLMVWSIPAVVTAAATRQSTAVDRPNDFTGRSIGLMGLPQINSPRGMEAETFLSYVNSTAMPFHSTAKAGQFRLGRTLVDPLGMTHVRVDQVIDGIPVFGAQLIGHFTSHGRLRSVNGDYSDKPVAGFGITVTVEEAVARAKDVFSTRDEAAPESEPALVYFPTDKRLVPAWHFVLATPDRAVRREYLIDASSGEVLLDLDGICYADAIGTGFGVFGAARNHVDTDSTGALFVLRDNTRQASNDPHGHGGLMANGAFLATFIATTTLPGTLASDPDNIWDTPLQAEAIDANVYGGLVYDWMLRELNRNSYDDNGSAMVSSVNYSGSNGPNNAFWNGAQVTYGIHLGSWTALSASLDVVAHEWAHGVTQTTSGMIRLRETGTLVESFSDMMGAAFEWAHDTLDVPDWRFAELGFPATAGTRSFSDPTVFGHPDYYGTGNPLWFDQTGCTPTAGNGECGIYINAGVSNKWFYLLSDGGVHRGVTVQGIGVANAIKVAYRANAYYWTPSADFHSAALGTVLAAIDLDSTYQWATSTADAWQAVNVSTVNPAISFSADSVVGWAPLTVQFSGQSSLAVDSWSWSFGDGDSAFVASPMHTYQEPGSYDVSLRLTAGAEERFLQHNQFVVALADSLIPTAAAGAVGGDVRVDLYARNYLPLSGMVIPFTWAGPVGLRLDSTTRTGLRTEAWPSPTFSHFDQATHRATMVLTAGSQPLLAPDTGAVVSLYFSVQSGGVGQTSPIVVGAYGTDSTRWTSPALAYRPIEGSDDVMVAGCCVGSTGNVNVDAADVVNLSDVTVLVNHLFVTFDPLVCKSEANVSGDLSCQINLTDLMVLINHLFVTFEPLPACSELSPNSCT